MLLTGANPRDCLQRQCANVVGGHIALLFADPAPALPLIKAGKVRALGVTSAALLPAAPDIPPLAKSGVPGFDASGWGMVVAPARTPAAIVAKLYDAFRTVESRSEVRDRLSFLGLAPQTSPPPESLQGFIDSELVSWGQGRQIRRPGGQRMID